MSDPRDTPTSTRTMDVCGGVGAGVLLSLVVAVIINVFI